MYNAQFRDGNRILLTSRFLLRQIFPQQPDQIPAVSRLRSADHFLHPVLDGADSHEAAFGNAVVGFFPQQAVDDFPIQAAAVSLKYWNVS